MEAAEIEAEEQRIKLEQEQEQKKVDQLVKSRVDYKGYFHSIPDVEHTAKQLDKLVEDDKQAKLDKLAEIEAAELQKATEGTVAPVKKDESKPEQELKEKIIPTDDTDKDAVKLWLGSFMDSAPKTKNGNLNETIDKAIEFVNDLLGKMY
jgi:protein subunit release factor A